MVPLARFRDAGDEETRQRQKQWEGLKKRGGTKDWGADVCGKLDR
jgi:hypothetical protein